MNVRTFTDEDRAWLKSNYPHLTNKKCMVHLKCGRIAFAKIVAECGLEYKTYADRHPKPQKEIHYAWQDTGCERFCLDCKNYREGGVCMKTGKVVGALWKKKCFKALTDERIRNHR